MQLLSLIDDESLTDCINQYIYLHNINSFLTEQKFLPQLIILSYLVPPKGRKVLEKRKVWKFSSSKATEGIILHVKEPIEIEANIDRQKNKGVSQ